MKRWATKWLAGMMLACCALCASAELRLVNDGQAPAPIIVVADAPPFTRRAADDLAEYIERISGARPEVLEGLPYPVPEHAIWIGVQPKLTELLPNIDFEFKHPEEILITATADHLVIAGRDRWDPDHLNVALRGKTVHGVQREYGTVNAVYTFIQDFLDVRWLWPGELGEDVIECSTLAFAPFVYRYHPQVRHRSGVLYMSALDGRRGQSHQWARRQRLQLDSLRLSPSCHGFTDWWERFGETHPEYFAMQPDGTRSGFPNPRCVKICQSNPAVWRQWIVDVESALQANPNQVAFDAGPNDDWSSGHCVCERCRNWDHPEGERRVFRWKGVSREQVALSDRDVTFYNHLARLLEERFPDRHLLVRGLSYGHTQPAPIDAVPADNVLISSVANFLLAPEAGDRGSSRDITYRERFRAWGKRASKLGWRPNIHGQWRFGLPDVQLKHVMQEFRFVAEHNCISMIVDTIPEFWGTQGPMTYLMAQLAWDPYQDAPALLDDYYARGFGNAAPTIARYWDLLECVSDRYDGSGRTSTGVYDAAFFQKAYGLLDHAAARVSDGPARFGQRVAFVRAGLDYARLFVDLREVMQRYHDSEKTDTAAAQEALAIWDEFKRIRDLYPYAINWAWLPGGKLMRGLHPDFVR